MKILKSTKYLFFTLFLVFTIFLSLISIPKFVKADTNTEYYNFTSSNIFVPVKSFTSNRDDNNTSSGLFNNQFGIYYDSEKGYYLDFSLSSLNFITYTASSDRTIMYTYSDLSAYAVTEEITGSDGQYTSIYTDFNTSYNLDKLYLSTLTGGVYWKDLTLNIIPTRFLDSSKLNGRNINEYTITLNIETNAITKDFIPNMEIVEFDFDLNEYGSHFGNRIWNFIKYTNTDGLYLKLSWYVGNSWCIDIDSGYVYAPQNSIFDYRKYYYFTDIKEDSLVNNAFEQGKQQGYKDGYKDGKEDGYSNGFGQGELKGYADGVNSKTDYTFLGLFTALIDAPIQAIFGNASGVGGLLNFEFLGINLSGFYLSIFTIMIVLMIIKVVMKGG